MASSAQTPPIRSFQFDANAVANVRSSVNLFRADVNLVQNLFTLPGRGGEQGMDVNVGLLYQSNVFTQAMLWNRDAPTGVLGLGWSLPETAIALEDGGSLAADARRYAYIANGASTPLVREPEAPQLFGMAAELADLIEVGELAPEPIRRLFGVHGLKLGADARISGGGDPEWSISDDEQQQSFLLRLLGGRLLALDGGESYQLQSYRFWKILYYPCYERWLIIDEHGLRMSFGGLDPDAARPGGLPAIPASHGDSIEWGVAWRNPASGELLWTGASGLVSGQAHYARSWRLSTTSNLWGDRVVYKYNEQWPVDPATGLRPVVEQAVSAPDASDPALGYTKACYLTSVTDVFGRRAVFGYEDKLWDDSSPESPREFADPHKPRPDNRPNAWQDRYETQYLSAITVPGAGGEPLLAIGLCYEPRPSEDGAASQVANVSDNTGKQYGDSFKRFLTGLQFRNGEGALAGSLRFDYWLESPSAETPGASPGAIRKATYPGGATAAWSYTRQSLPACNRSLTVTPPDGLDDSSTPTVWFGPDYVVTLWRDSEATTLTLQAHCWIGRWLTWQLSDAQAAIFADPDGFDPTSLRVSANASCMAVSFNTVDQMQVYVFTKDVARPGQWSPALLSGSVTGFNRPTVSYDIDSAEVLPPLGGRYFLVISRMDPTYGRYALDRLTWRWTTGEWTLETTGEGGLPPLDSYTWVTAQNEYYLTVDLRGQVSVTRLDAQLNWRPGGRAALPDTENLRIGDLALAPSASWVVASQLRVRNASTCAYTLHLLQWDAAYQFVPVVSRPFSDPQDPSGADPTSWIPTVIGNSQAACAGNLLRFNGERWLTNTALALRSVPNGLEQRYAYGDDVAVQILARSGGQGSITAAVVAYDPDADVSRWQDVAAVTPTAPLRNPETNAATANYPSCGGGDYLLIGPWLYFRDHAGNWANVVSAEPLSNIEAQINAAMAGQGKPGRYVMNSKALVDESPAFLACSVFDSESEKRSTCVVLLENGGLSQNVVNPLALSADAQMSLSSTPGSAAAGPSMFVTYPGTAESFSDARLFTLRQYAGNAVNGEMMHYAVTGFSADNGFDGGQPSAIVQELASATCDATGSVFKYYQSTVYPGSPAGPGAGGVPAIARYGSVQVRYLNGLDDQTGDNFYDMLDGLLHDVMVRNAEGETLAQTSLDWRVWTERSPDPADAGAPPVKLAGGFVCKTGVTRFADGVNAELRISALGVDAEGRRFAAPWSSQPVAQWVTALGASGEPETHSSATLYGCERDPMLRALNILSAKLQSTSGVAVGDGPEIPLSATAYARALWPCARGPEVRAPGLAGVYAWRGIAPPDYPFDSVAPGKQPDPAGWLCRQRVIDRTLLGLPTEWADACDIITSVEYSEPDSLPIAQVVNASRSHGQWAFESFEAESGASAWKADNAQICDDDAYTGRRSLHLAVPGASLTACVTPAAASGPYLLAYAVKTLPGYSVDTGAGWTLTIEAHDRVVSERSVPFEDTKGLWAWRTVGVVLPTDADGPLIVTAKAENTDGQPVWLDAVALAPLASRLSAQTFDQTLRRPTSALDGGGRKLLTAYNRFYQAVATLGPDAQVALLTQQFASPQGNAAGVFDPESPGASLSLQPAGQSRMETFRAGDEWRERWTPSNPADWEVLDGALHHLGREPGSLAWNGWDPTPPATAAIFVELYPPQGLSGELAWALDGAYRLGWDAARAGWFLEGPEGFAAPTPLAHPPAMPQQWLLVFGDGVLLLFGDGQLSYSLAWPIGAPTSFCLQTGVNALEVRNLAAMAAPRLSIDYLDGAGATRQTQRLHGADALITQSVQDALGRTLASTKPAPARFGEDADLPLMAYHPHFVDVQAFLAATADSWLMEGDVADFYAGQSEFGVTRSDDQGYPYAGTRFEASPCKRRLESGQPGRELAIHDLLNTGETDRLTVQYRYGDADDGGFLTRGAIDPLKTSKTTVSTVTGQTVATRVDDARGQVVAETRTTIDYRGPENGPAGQRRSLRLPNAFGAPPQGDPEAFVSRQDGDPLGEVCRNTTPDTGQASVLYDPMGRWRFMQPALDPGESWFLYAKYDALGRKVEEGVVQAAWDQGALKEIAAVDPDYPRVGDDAPYEVSRLIRYDGDGDDPRQIGLPVEISTWTRTAGESGEPWLTTEQFWHDNLGRPIRTRMAVSLPGTPVAEIGYSYDALGEVSRLTLPAGAPLGGLRYAYDDLGQVSSIHADREDGGVELARYAYAASGAVTLEDLNAGRIRQRYSYDSPGWLREQSVSLVDEGEEQPAWALAVEHNPLGKVRQRAETIAFPGEAPEQTMSVYEHDAAGRLTRADATGSHESHWRADSYDANGNLWAATLDDAALRFTGQPGSDRLADASLGEAPAIAVSYNARGQLTAAGGLGVDYDPGLAMPCALGRRGEDSAIHVRLAYGGRQQRSVKQTTDEAGVSTRFYVCGAGTRPLAFWQDGEWTSSVTGPTGLIALAWTEAGLEQPPCFVLKDTQASVRAIIGGDDRLVGRYRYGVFGAPVGSGGSRPEAAPWRFMGQEWDAEVGLYNFQSRLYDPGLCRFLQPDPGGQYASPYVFVGNDPVSLTDPDGCSAHWAQIATTAFAAAVTVTGLALTVFTAGGSDAAAAGFDASLAAADAGEAAVDLAQAGADAAGAGSSAVDSTGAALDSGMAGGEVEVDAGVGTSVAANSGDVARGDRYSRASGSSEGGFTRPKKNGETTNWFGMNVPTYEGEITNWDRENYELRRFENGGVGDADLEREAIQTQAHEEFHKYVMENYPTVTWLQTEKSEWLSGILLYPEEFIAYWKGYTRVNRYSRPRRLAMSYVSAFVSVNGYRRSWKPLAGAIGCYFVLPVAVPAGVGVGVGAGLYLKS
ncbi:hypothetical protein C5688_20575 [Methylocystis sp. MitZ-2018]|uniref:RHS repeat domain-containing protein n=1 Tax=Methylosinus sporium TaxID=428 RepID=UPI000D59BCB3|nr:RHS repeat-associated core domain-containing protein [Methylosinus sporium]PWB88518.1 hypothetical protein C5688_20575 [Methylocystis sp. MitZ-2018]